MMRRALLVILVVVALVGLLALLPDGAPRPPFPRTLPDPVVLADSAGASTWYCTAASAGTPTSATHQVTISNPTGHALTAALSGYGSAEGGVPTTATVEVPARAAVVVDRAGFGGDASGSVLVEVTGGGVAVSHRLIDGPTSDEAPCVTSPSSTWYFPSLNTQIGNSARLWIFNPFAADAAVDITVASTDGVRIPRALSALVIPARTARFVDLGETEQRRDQFAISVKARAGQFTAELVEQTAGAPTGTGLRLDPGMPRSARRILFADSFGAENVHERVIVFNPHGASATATVSVRPDGADVATYPEPFRLEVPARRFVTVDLDAETRLPPSTSRTVTVETGSPAGLVASRVVWVSGSPNGLGVESGTANSVGATAAAMSWVVPRLDAAGPGRSFVRIANLSAKSIAVVRLRVMAAGVVADAVPGGKVEVPAGGSATLDVGAVVAADVPGVLVATSASPIVVERRALASTTTDFWMLTAIPVGPTVSALRGLPALPPKVTSK